MKIPIAFLRSFQCLALVCRFVDDCDILYVVSSCSLRFCGSRYSVYQGVLFRKMDCLVISEAWMSRVLERAKSSSLSTLWGSNLKS